jgi:hypothetical protein
LSSSVAQLVVSQFQIAEEYSVLLDHLVRTFDQLLGNCIRYGTSQQFRGWQDEAEADAEVECVYDPEEQFPYA